MTLAMFCACQARSRPGKPSIMFKKLPPAGIGSPDKLYPIAGSVTGAEPGQRIVLFAHSGIWWVQPTGDAPYTAIQPDFEWNNVTHPGTSYAALLVAPDYKPPRTAERLPGVGKGVLAMAVVEGAALAPPEQKTIRFSGYEWEVRQSASDRGGSRNQYDPSNVWTDDKGLLHLKLVKKGEEWTSAEVRLTRNLGYGSYEIVVQDVEHLEPSAVFSIFTWADPGESREMDIEISRWGEKTSRNAQYVVQPYYLPANVVRFAVPGGTLTHRMLWEPGRVTFRTTRGAARDSARIVDEHTFSSGVPSPGNEFIHINLYRFENRSNPLQRECEVVIEKFEYLP